MEYLHSSFDPEQLPEMFDELPLWSAPFGLSILNQIEYKKGITALDIGFGTGFPMLELAMRLGNSSTVYGIDPWEAAIRRAGKKLAYYGIRNVKIIRGEAEDIPLDDGSVDLITSNNGINNAKDMAAVLRSCARVLRPGGQLVQTMNLDLSMTEFYRVMEQVLRERDMNREVAAMHDHISAKRPPLLPFIQKIEENGFSITRMEHSQFHYTFTDGSAFFRHYFIRLAFMDSWKELLPEHLQVEIFQEVENRLNELAELAGSLTISIPFVTLSAIRKPLC